MVLHPDADDIAGSAQGVHFSLGIEMLEVPFLNKIQTLATIPIHVPKDRDVLI